MWLKIIYHLEDVVYWPEKPENISVCFDMSKTAPVDNGNNNFRLSPIFPLIKNDYVKAVNNTTIHFFYFKNAFRVLGRIEKKGTKRLKKCVFFSLGLASVILISKDEKTLAEFKKIAGDNELGSESWEIEGSKIKKVIPRITETDKLPINVNIPNYDCLGVTERGIIDEFKINIKLLLLKLTHHMPEEQKKISKLIEQVNALIVVLVYLQDQKGEIPDTVSEFTETELADIKVKELLKHQYYDRIIQINSALSYVMTQAFSGAIPILERRSLIRRNSLLGTGTAILALNNIASFIENAFSVISIDKVITNYMTKSGPMEGLTLYQDYDPSNWDKKNIDVLYDKEKEKDESQYKLPYFSGRLGFRETEFSIAAAIQSITSGAGIEWSLMTLTHEMLHGFVRKMIGAIMFGSDRAKTDDLRTVFYKRYKANFKSGTDCESAVESVRNILFYHSCLTVSMGSLTSSKISNTNKSAVREPQNEDGFWEVVSGEYRNISEIFVHVLDLHYFYAGRTTQYIPLIWGSWLSVPHVNVDIRQYILRSLLAIASRKEGESVKRFWESVNLLKEIFEKHKDGRLAHPTIDKCLGILNKMDLLRNDYFLAFEASLIVVDLTYKVFLSEKIKGNLLNDDLIRMEEDEKNEIVSERKFTYKMQEGFNDIEIKAPLSYLFDRMNRTLDSKDGDDELERETTILFLALCSN